MYRFVFTWRWIRLHVLIWLILIPAFIGLGLWQQSRYHERQAENKVLSGAMNGAPVPVASLDPVAAVVDKSLRWRQVTVTGTYDSAHEYLARNRQQNGNPGFYVVTPLVAADGTAVLVNRGWIATASVDPQVSPTIPPPPHGQVTLTGRLQPTETKNSTGIKDITAGLPAGQISLINTEALAEASGLKLRGGYVEQISSTPQDDAGITKLDAPTLETGPYLAYWFQWWLFAAMAVGAWVTIIRREAQHRAADALDDEDEEGDEYDEYDEYEDEDEQHEAADEAPEVHEAVDVNAAKAASANPGKPRGEADGAEADHSPGSATDEPVTEPAL